MSNSLLCRVDAAIVGSVIYPTRHHVPILMFLLCCTAVNAETPRGSIEISASLYNPDWEFRENATGLRLSGMWMLGSHFRIRGTYNSIDTNFVDLPIVGLRGLPFGNWREAGLGYIWELTDRTAVEAELSYQGVELYDKTKSGSAISAGFMHRFSERFSGSLRLSYFDLESRDWRVTGDFYTAISERFDLVARIDDTSEFDFTWYEIGLRIRF